MKKDILNYSSTVYFVGHPVRIFNVVIKLLGLPLTNSLKFTLINIWVWYTAQSFLFTGLFTIISRFQKSSFNSIMDLIV